MASFLPGMTDYLPQLQPFSPDLNLYAKVLQTKQSKYDSAYNQISETYGDLLYSPMLRDKNIKDRDTFFNDATAKIRQVSGLDLSLEQNQDMALNIFKPLYENKSIMKDMVWTKQLYNEMQTGQNYKNCVDLEKCGGGYWDDGIKDLKYKAEEFKNASDDDALNFAAPRFIPYQNVGAKAEKLAKEFNVNIKRDSNGGNYIVTTKNGDAAIPYLSAYFNSTLGKDPLVMDYYTARARIARKEYGRAKGGNDPQAQSAAEDEYIQNIYSGLTQKVVENRELADDHVKTAQAKENLFAKDIEENGIIVNPTNVDEYNRIQQEKVIANTNYEIADGYHKTAQAITTNRFQRDILNERIDELVAGGLFKQDIDVLSRVYADKDSEVSIKEDPFKLALYRSELEDANNARSSNRQLEMKEAEYRLKAKYGELKGWTLSKEGKIVEANDLDSPENANVHKTPPQPLPDEPGSGTPTDILLFGKNINDMAAKRGEVTSNQRDILKNALDNYIGELQTANAYGDTDKATQVRAILKNIINSMGYNIKSDAELSSIIGKDVNSYINKLPDSQIDKSYDYISKIVSQSTYEVNKEFITTTKPLIDKAETDKVAYTIEVQRHKKNADNAMEYAIPELRKKIPDAIELKVVTDAYMDIDGDKPNSKERFTEKYIKGIEEHDPDGYAEYVRKESFVKGATDPQTGKLIMIQKHPEEVKLNYEKTLSDKASKLYDLTDAEWKSNYNNIGTSVLSKSNSLEVGNSSMRAMPYKENVDYSDLKNPNARIMNQVFDDANKPGSFITFGGFGKIPEESDPDAKKVINFIDGLTHYSYKLNDPNKLQFSVNRTAIAGMSDKYMAVTIMPTGYGWAEKVLTKKAGTDEESVEKIDRGLLDKMDKGVTIFIPKNQASNPWNSQISSKEIILNNGRSLNYTASGNTKVSIKKDLNTGKLMMSGWVGAISTETGEPVPKKLTNDNSLSFPQNIEQAESYVSDYLQKLDEYNASAYAQFKNKHGIRSYSQYKQKVADGSY